MVTSDDRLDISADKEEIDKELEKDISQSVYTIKTGFFLESLKRQEKFDDIESFIELFENEKKSDEDVQKISKNSTQNNLRTAHEK